MSENYNKSVAVEEELQKIQSLEQKCLSKSRFRRLTFHLEPLIDFLLMYSPAVDIIVQFDANPSAVIWGSLKAIIKIAQNSIKYYAFIERMLVKIADIVSTSARYEILFETEARVQKALTQLYLEISQILQCMQSTLSHGSLRIVANSIFRSVDIKFQANLQRLARRNDLFKEEVTLAHRVHLEQSVMEQKKTQRAVDQIASRCEQEQIRNVERIARQVNETRTSIMKWIGRVDCTTSFRRASKKRLPDTGFWLLGDPIFRNWIGGCRGAQNSSLLWIFGAPGVGKTVLSAMVIEHIQRRDDAAVPRDAVVAYYYCDSTDRRNSTAASICANFLSQILGTLNDVPRPVSDRYANAKRHGRDRISEEDGIFDMFEEVVIDFPCAFLIIDGLDECSEIFDVISWLKNASRSVPSIHVLCFSRDTAGVRDHLEKQPSIRISECLIKHDVDRYLLSAISTLQFEGTALRNRIFETLSRKTAGMFLFADLCIQTLRSAVDTDDALKILENVPAQVNEMYNLLLNRLNREPQARKSLVHRVFRILCVSARPITWPELCCALSWDEGSQSFRKSREPFKKSIVQLCCPLVEHYAETDTFVLVHFSFHEYLLKLPAPGRSFHGHSTFAVEEDQAQSELAQITMTYLVGNDPIGTAPLEANLFPLISYAVEYWCHHLSKSPYDQKLHAMYQAFVACPRRRSAWILKWLLLKECSFPLQQVVKLSKSIQEWAIRGGTKGLSIGEILTDIQAALFCFDESPPNTGTPAERKDARTISNFERLVCVRDLAREYTMTGETDNGIEMFEIARQNVESSYGGISVHSCWILNSLGILYDQQGKTKMAEETQLKALAIQEEILPARHLDTVLTINELGRIAWHLEQYQKAEALHRKALQVLEQMFLEDDLHITWTKSALGRSLLKQNRPKEALVLHQQVLTIETSRLGRDHPHTLWTLSDITRCYSAMNRIEEATTAQQEVTERSRKALGDDNPDTLWAMNSLGILHELSGNSRIAEDLHTQAFQGQTKVLGIDHKHTQWSRLRLENFGE